jgi:glycosyltransferase involved in cell wall biosynthesis
MQILFVHSNFPAQFGHVAKRLVHERGVDAVFVTRALEGAHDGVRVIRYDVKGGATRANHHCSRTFENAVWQAHAVYEACKAAKLDPDLVVGHSGFGSTVFLPELYRAPIVSYFEYYYHAHGCDMDFRPDFPPEELDFLRAHARNAMILLDLAACAAGYAPTEWQKGLLPPEWQPKVDVIHDGVDTAFWRRQPGPRRIGLETIPDDVRVVTYVARGLEAMRGFDVFVRVAKRIAAEMPNVLFVVVGGDRIHYGNDLRHIKAKTFREHVLATERPDLRRFRFLGTVPGEELAAVLSASDLHLYLTVPFVPSWSLLDALACECVVLASDVPPVREIVRHGENGLLADFFDVDGLAAQAVRVLQDPIAFRKLALAGRATVEERYSVDVTLPRLWALFERALATR